MADVYLAIAIVVSVSVLLGVLAYRVARRRGIGVMLVLGAAVGVVMNVLYWREGLWAARVLPFSNIVVLGDLGMPLAAILIGGAAALMPGSGWRRSVLLVPLAVVGVWSSLGMLVAPLPTVHNRWHAGVCRQTTLATCSPAAGATLLAARGIRASEGEMAQLCLTTLDGTSSRGLYRGLKLKTAGTPYDVRVIHGDLATLRAALADGPLLLTVKLASIKNVDPRFYREWGWAPGVAHNVVVFGLMGDTLYDVGDPAVGREAWDRRALDVLWHGEGLQLVRR